MTFTVESSGEQVAWYHNGESKRPDYNPKTFRRKPMATIDKLVIAWDMEGISLSGQDRPQHSVLWGCSAHVDAPLLASSNTDRITSQQMLEYIIDIGRRFPDSLHVGYGFKYDANMLIAGLSKRNIVQLWHEGRTSFRFDREYRWSIRWVPGKMFTVTKRWGAQTNSRAKTSVTIYDFASFFGKKFIDTCEQILGDDLDTGDREVILRGKEDRGSNTWEDMPDVIHYWQKEIILMKRVFEKFRDVMHRAGFPLKEWYGPGALANFINQTKGIRPILVGVQTNGTLSPEAHFASKVAFSGGRFELFQAGRIHGPVYAVDINSAYPYALTKLPSFENGRWVHTTNPTAIARFGIYRITYKNPDGRAIEFRPQPLFWRDARGMISYPNLVHGWYYSPEAAMVLNMPGVTIHEGLEWESTDLDGNICEERPWSFLAEMYDTRMRLGKKNLMSMPFKLGPNSLYGKYAQTVGWDQKKLLPPKSHALPVAGWVTSYCRAMLWTVMRQSPSTVIGVETDSVFMSRHPSELDIRIGDKLGEWSVSEYDEMVYIQSGMYHTRKGDKWSGTKSRGMTAKEYPYADIAEYLSALRPSEPWDKMRITTKPRFIGAGAALASSAPFRESFTSWRSQPKEIGIGDSGKRVHNHALCPSCREGLTPDQTTHRLFVNSRSDGTMMSFPRRLPWETGQTEEVSILRHELDIESQLLEPK